MYQKSQVMLLTTLVNLFLASNYMSPYLFTQTFLFVDVYTIFSVHVHNPI